MSMMLVALRKESVDRNQRIAKPFREQFVALRKESVDRNISPLSINYMTHTSLSARRAWIEIMVPSSTVIVILRRSPQGERG